MKRYFFLMLFLGMLLLPKAFAEGSIQTGLNQFLYDYDAGNGGGLLSATTHPLYVILNSATEVINVSMCNSSSTLYFEVWNEAGTTKYYTSPTVVGATGPTICSLTSSTSSLNPAAGFRWSPQDYLLGSLGAGTYQIRLFNLSTQNFLYYDISVTASKLDNPDPSQLAGRLFAYHWPFNANNYTLATSTDANYFALVPGGRPNTNYVWQLDLNNFAGFVYDIIANDTGVNGQDIVYSTPFSGYSVTELYPIYLAYPVNAFPEPTQPPQISNVYFTDSAGVDHTISPSSSVGVQDTGRFHFESDVEGTYLVILDANRDGIFGNSLGGIDDVYLFDRVLIGSNTVVWDGKDNQGNSLSDGAYQAKLEVRIGEYHFIAGDAETSGGGTNDGLTIYRALSNTNLQPAQVFWDDLTGFDPDKAGNGGSTLPAGQTSVVGQSSGSFRHTWVLIVSEIWPMWILTFMVFPHKHPCMRLSKMIVTQRLILVWQKTLR